MVTVVVSTLAFKTHRAETCVGVVDGRAKEFGLRVFVDCVGICHGEWAARDVFIVVVVVVVKAESAGGEGIVRRSVSRALQATQGLGQMFARVSLGAVALLEILLVDGVVDDRADLAHARVRVERHFVVAADVAGRSDEHRAGRRAAAGVRVDG